MNSWIKGYEKLSKSDMNGLSSQMISQQFIVRDLIQENTIKQINMNNYRIISNIGSGAYSTVHKAIDVTTGHIVAIKKISSENINIQHIIKRQVAFLKQCIGHPNIIQLENCISVGNYTYLIFEYMGMDLISYYKSVEESRKRKLNDQEICYISYQLCNALNFLHERGIMHRDIKPQNVLIDPDTLKVKLIDFGFAKQNISQINTNYMVTRWYRPLQIVLGLPYDQKVDVFATGALILQLYLGNQIFRSSSNIDQFYWIVKICGNPPATWNKAQQAIIKLNLSCDQNSSELNEYVRHLRPPVADLITKMLKTSPHERISMKQVLNHPYFSRFKIKTVLMANKPAHNFNRHYEDISTKKQLYRNPSYQRNRAFSTQQQSFLNQISSRHFTTKTQASQNPSSTQQFSQFSTNIIKIQNQNFINKTQEHVPPKKGFIKRVSTQKNSAIDSRQNLNDKNAKNKLQQKSNKPQQKSKGPRNRVKSMTGHGINVVSLKKLKIHRQIDNQKSKRKKEYKVKGEGQVLRLNPKKDRPMFLRVKDKINQGRLNERGQQKPQISTGVSVQRALGIQMIPKIQSTAQLKVRKVAEYKEYMFKD